MNNTAEKAFYHLIFKNINESDYKVLFSKKGSRPNAPVNVLISALILKERKSWSYDELMESMMFDMRTKVALGLVSIGYKSFSRAALFNFPNRLLNYEQKTGTNLLEKTFDNLTAEQLEKLKIKTSIQRSDSTLISSNIKKYSRVQLLIEVLLRMSGLFDKADKDASAELIEPYSKLVSINFGRICRLIVSKSGSFDGILTYFNILIAQIAFFLNLTQITACTNENSKRFSNSAFIRT